ncbi:hypothetical protein CLV49_0599 [Labedella gwakjiensis]|uniref:Lipoprotein n=2 Tax=Labedella gwakjiensis TaxID=390269 RepID=A0A2P8GSP9_9MICO|nr:hypothetical protein [Labedella gwakjiensis]PSL36996.1 hypothetical protein CLV49_0599 [Labedella gwakjiensis]
MKKTIAAWTIAGAAVLGLAACTSAPSSDAGSASASASSAPSSAPAEAPASDQSVADACSSVQSKIEDATTAVSDIDMSNAANDPQGTVQTFTETAEAIGAAADSVSNNEVKTAVSTVYEDLIALRDVVSSVLVDGDMAAASGLTSAVTDVQTSAQELATLCS